MISRERKRACFEEIYFSMFVNVNKSPPTKKKASYQFENFNNLLPIIKNL